MPPSAIIRVQNYPQPSPILRGSTVILLCAAISGDPPISYSWIDPLGNTVSFDARLSIDISYFGNYTCRASNHVGITESAVELVESGIYNNCSEITDKLIISIQKLLIKKRPL